MKNISELCNECKCNTCKLSHVLSKDVCYGYCENECNGKDKELANNDNKDCYEKYFGDIFNEYCKNECLLKPISKSCLIVDNENDLCIIEHYNNYLGI